MRDVRSDERRYLVQLPWNPFITGLIDTFVDQRNFYYLLELAPCTSFAHYLSKRGRISTADARFYFSNIVLAIEFLHTHDVVHRDVKPGNLMLGGDGYISLGDFGCATHQSDDRDWEGFGTREYLAPELHEGNTVYPQGRKFVDWWSAAVTLFEMVTSKLVRFLIGEVCTHAYPCFTSHSLAVLRSRFWRILHLKKYSGHRTLKSMPTSKTSSLKCSSWNQWTDLVSLRWRTRTVCPGTMRFVFIPSCAVISNGKRSLKGERW